MFYTYILYSKKLNKYYVGHTKDFERRFEEHNRGKSRFSKSGIPWEKIKVFECMTNLECCNLEDKIKKRGCERFLKDLEISS